MTEKEKCPACGSVEGLRRASSDLRHWLRTFTRSRRRYCPWCGARWHSPGAVKLKPLSPSEIALLICLVLPPLVVAAVNHPNFLRAFFSR